MSTRSLILVVLVSAAFSKQTGLNVLIMGDFGGANKTPYTTSEEVSSAHYMSQVASRYSVDMVWTMGDNIYDYGVTDEHDKRFNETFESVFSQESLLTIPYYMTAGNHDWNGNVSGQIFYSNHSTRWMYPNYYYSSTWLIPGTSSSVQLVMIDTIIACGLSYDSLQQCNSLGVANERCHIEQPQLDTHEQSSAADKQWQWLESTLKQSTAHYLFVAGHYPVWNVGDHKNTECLVETLRPLLQQYGATMYINGHSHTMEYIVEDDYPNLPYVTSGATHGCEGDTYNNTIPQSWLKFHGCKDGGFNRLYLNETCAYIQFYFGNSDEVQFQSEPIFPRR